MRTWRGVWVEVGILWTVCRDEDEDSAVSSGCLGLLLMNLNHFFFFVFLREFVLSGNKEERIKLCPSDSLGL